MHSNARSHDSHIGLSSNPANISIILLLTLLLLVFLLLFMTITASSAYGQQSVPPTARQAATMPQFASRLAHPAASQRASRSPYPVPPRASYKNPLNPRVNQRGGPLDANEIYDNGAINGTTDAWTINFGFVVSDSFTVGSSGGTANGLSFGAWLFPGDVLQTVEVQITSAEFGGTVFTDQTVSFTQSGCSGNQYGFNVCTETGNLSATGLAPGTYWVNLDNAVVNDGDPLYWDENSGPSMASENTVGTIPSEAFTVGGGSNCQYPPCDECVYDKPQDGFKIIHNFNANEDPDAGLAIDRASNVYGATSDGGNNGQGFAYKLAQVTQDWIFTPLYSFLGGSTGQNPAPGILGPEGALYGAAGGGLQTCGSSGTNYCGLIYRLRPAPFACLTALCSWNEEVIYRFTGTPDGSGPNGSLVFDPAGNLYGTTAGGGTYGLGTVYELTPSNDGWTEKVIYSFTGQNGDGIQPVSLVLGQDGNLYGTTARDYSQQGGIYFQLVHSGDSWEEQIISTYGPCGQGFVCTSPLLILEHSGSFYGIDSYSQQTCNPPPYCHPDDYGRILTLTQVGSGWQFSIFYDTFGDFGLDGAGYDIIDGLSIDSSGTVYATEGGSLVLQLIDFGGVLKLPQPHQGQSLVSFQGDDFHDVEIGAGGNLYGVTGRCNGTPGTVWQLMPQ